MKGSATYTINFIKFFDSWQLVSVYFFQAYSTFGNGYSICEYSFVVIPEFSVNTLKLSCLSWQGFDSLKKEVIKIEHMDFWEYLIG